MLCRMLLMMVALFLLPAGQSRAGVIHGTITCSEDSLAVTKVTIMRGEKIVAVSRTDEKGGFSVYISQTGTFRLCLPEKDKDCCISVRSKRSSNSYDLEIYKDGTKWHLRRNRQ